MDKAILVIDMPESCDDCDFCYYSDGTVLSCRLKLKSTDGCRNKPDWCPLKPVPRMRFTYIGHDDEATANYNRGWNDCLEKIKGE